MISSVIKSMRPKQWTKNFFVFAGLLFTLDSPHPIDDYFKVVLAFVVFCLLSGVVYIVNDVRDVQGDRKHPKKSKRPIASGALSARAALVWAAALLVVAAAVSTSLNKAFILAGVAYLALQIAYTFALKEIVILDVMAIAFGFVIRAVAGAAAISVNISPWLFICTILLALFLALAKRRGELVRVEAGMPNSRASLDHYTVPFLDQLIGITSASTIIAYSLYTFFSKTGEIHPFMMATLPFVIYGIFRYLLLIHREADAESPEMLLLTDKPLLIDIGLWAIACALIVASR
ncbi:MAG TPA: decaprenyl-phosphate phosphoribosyltransferase [Armatimonadota bacterium]|nr:decaprenyl-phosphate phosphoribosyltransferase [Armatimonadota bacterium]